MARTVELENLPKVLCVVPARGGSKGIPNKNLKKIGGKSLIEHAYEVIMELEPFFRVYPVLSTDSIDIEAEGRKIGFMIPFLRPECLADDQANSTDVWRHAWVETERVIGESFEYSLLLEPTSPMRHSKDLLGVLEQLIRSNKESVVTVSKTPAHFTPEKTLIIKNGKTLRQYLGLEGNFYSNRHNISTSYYHRNGVCYGARKKFLFQSDDLVTKAWPYIIHNEVVNIDSQKDLEYARYLMRKKNSGK